MKIYIDNIAYKLQNAGGVSVYLTELIERMLLNHIEVNFIEQKGQNNNIFRNKISIPNDRIIIEKGFPSFLKRYLAIQAKIESNSIIHSSYYRWSKRRNVTNIITVYDFTYEYFTRGLYKYIHALQKKNAIYNAAGIICISESTKRDLMKLYGNIDERKIRVIYLAASNNYYQLRNEDNSDSIIHKSNAIIDGKYIIYVGGRGSYKNFGVAVGTVKEMKGHKFIIIGGGPLTKSELTALENGLPKRYFHLGNVESDTLNNIYNHAFCLLFPSSYEGFGIPILEAMQAGCPVVTTNKSSIPEVCGNAGLMVDIIQPNEFIKLIRLLEKPLFRDDIIQNGLVQSKKFSWDRMYNETIDFYKTLSNIL